VERRCESGRFVSARKVCIKCGQVKRLPFDFPRRPKLTGGYENVCKQCRYRQDVKARNAKNPAVNQSRDWRSAMGGEKLEHQVMVRLSSELHVEILAAANAEERTISGWIRVAMKEKLESRAAVVP
jgi:hypothetical protein